MPAPETRVIRALLILEAAAFLMAACRHFGLLVGGFERAYFQRFDGAKQVWEVVFYVLSSDIGLHMDRQHQVNLALHKCFLLEGIDIGGLKKAA